MKSRKILILALASLLFLPGFLSANYAFKKKVKDVCKSYRISLESSQLSLNENEVEISLESVRNNLKCLC